MRKLAVFAFLALLAAIAVGGLVRVIAQSSGGAGSAIIGALLAAIAVVVLARADVGSVLNLLDAARVAGPVFAYIAFYDLMGESAGTISFDEIGAQVIVVLVLALAVEARFFRLQVDRDRLDLMATILIMLILASGEYYALKGVFTDNPEHGEMVAGAIAAGFVAVAIAALAGPERRAQEES